MAPQNWELNTFAHNELDRAQGFAFKVQSMAGGSAAKDYVSIPYSKAVGGLLVGTESTAQSLVDLKGAKIDIAGGPLDKNWLISQVYAAQEYGFDLATETEQFYGALPLIFKSALSGETTGAINFWHFLAKIESLGVRKLVDVSDAACV